MRCVCGNVTTFVISMDGDVESHEFVELRVCESNLVCIIGRVVKRTITSGDRGVVSVDVVVDDGCDA